MMQLPTASFNPDHVETLDDWIDRHKIADRDSDADRRSDPDGELSTDRARRRARRKVSDYIKCNPDMNYFVTLTLDPEKVDRHDYSAVIRQLNNWLGNRVRRNGLKYLLIPEPHKDGAIHFHGVCNDRLDLIFSGRYLRNGKAVRSRSGKKIYNIADYDLGYTTAIRITGSGSTEAVAAYVMKYITKDFRKIGGRYYLHGGDLIEPEFEYFNLCDHDIPADQIPYTCEFEIYPGAFAHLWYGEKILTFLGLLKEKSDA